MSGVCRFLGGGGEAEFFCRLVKMKILFIRKNGKIMGKTIKKGRGDFHLKRGGGIFTL